VTYQTVTLRPTSLKSAGTGVTLTGGSLPTILADSTDATYVDFASGCRNSNQVLQLGFGPLTLPAGAQIQSVTLRERDFTVTAATSPPQCYFGLCVNDSPDVFLLTSALDIQKLQWFAPHPQTTTGQWVTQTIRSNKTAPDGTPWTVSDFASNFYLEIGRTDLLAASRRVSEVYLDINYNVAATLTATGPSSPVTTTSTPTVTWTYVNNTDGLPQKASRTVIYTAAQIAAVGFVAGTSPGYADSGWVLGQQTQWIVDKPLPNGSYTAYCVDMETEILTIDGWKSRGQLSVGDVALTLNHETGLSEWQPVTHIHDFGPKTRRMLSMEGQNHSSLTTEDHRWPVVNVSNNRAWKTSSTLKRANWITLAAPCVDLPTEAKYHDAVVELVAWAWTEGTLISGGGLNIYQSHSVNPGHCANIRRALTDLYGPPVVGDLRSFKPRNAEADRKNSRRAPRAPYPAWREHDRGNGRTVFILNAAAAAPVVTHMDNYKVVNSRFISELTASQLSLFVERSIDADGCRGGTNPVVVQKSADRLAPVQMACSLLGKASNLSTRRADGCYSLGIRGKTRLEPMGAASQPGRFQAKWVNHDGAVWCPTLKNGTWLARRRGSVYYTGNCEATQTWDGPTEFYTNTSSITWTQSITACPNAVLSSTGWDPATNTVPLTAVPSSSSPSTDYFRFVVSRNGAPYVPVFGSAAVPANGMTPVTIVDNEAPSNLPSTYQVLSFKMVSGVAQPAAAYSNTVSVTPTVSGGVWWLKDRLNYLSNTKLPVFYEGDQVTQSKSFGTAYVLGTDADTIYPVVTENGRYGTEGTLTVMFVHSRAGDAQWAAFDALDLIGRTLILCDPAGGVRYVRLVPGQSGQAKTWKWELTAANGVQYRKGTVPYTEVGSA
jgi:hypothetical protein